MPLFFAARPSFLARICATLAVAVFATIGLQSQEARAVNIQEVTSPGGLKAWLVEERDLPLLAMRFSFGGGAAQDPAAHSGVANFLSTMLDEGAGDMDAATFQERLEELAVRLSFEAGRDSFSGSLQTLTENRDEAVALLRLALTEPRFDEDAIERMRQSHLASIAFDLKDPNRVGSRLWWAQAFPGHPYGRTVSGTDDTVRAIDAEALRAFHGRVFARDNLHISVVGDIDAATLGPLLDNVFGGLPAKGDLTDTPDIAPKSGPITRVVEMPVPQSVATFGHGGLKRDDPDYIPAVVLNYVLGGGGFSSRLMEEVREKRGLAYSVWSSVYPLDHSAIFIGSVATKNEAVGESLIVIRDVLSDIAENGLTDDELQGAKDHLTGSYALRFDTNSKIAGQLLWIQVEDLGLDYVNNRNDLINAVTSDDIRRAAGRLLKPDGLVVTVVGQPEGVADEG